jgi:hypothetical protein
MCTTTAYCTTRGTPRAKASSISLGPAAVTQCWARCRIQLLRRGRSFATCPGAAKPKEGGPLVWTGFFCIEVRESRPKHSRRRPRQVRERCSSGGRHGRREHGRLVAKALARSPNGDDPLQYVQWSPAKAYLDPMLRLCEMIRRPLLVEGALHQTSFFGRGLIVESKEHTSAVQEEGRCAQVTRTGGGGGLLP